MQVKLLTDACHGSTQAGMAALALAMLLLWAAALSFGRWQLQT